MTPLAYYREQCRQGLIVGDPLQESVLEQFDLVQARLVAAHQERQGILSFLKKPHPVKGIYLWGKVGVGKTFMMDAFYECLPFPDKMRMHFHNFMALVHEELKLHQGKKNPLQAVADDIARRASVLCLDELIVSDITDAMLLGGLFEALFDRGVTLTTTSNQPPDKLYHNGLQRERFLPAIGLLNRHTDVIHILSETDYRLRHSDEAGAFFTPLDAAAKAGMEKTFYLLAETAPIATSPVLIRGRQIPVIRRCDSVVWFHFKNICEIPRSQHDYLEIAKRYRTVLISDIPAIPPEAKDTICLFVNLVDVFYDARVRLVISAAEPVSELYQRGFMILEYARTHSRLMEMQSSEYFRAND